ncbi:response regulator transcription factor [Microbacterium azadirachtae]|uniref:Two component transcriptional regulator, LuxR family n=1 Tax=Microbacterium azadirachtae TaxID=582680 RepID=A0A1I6G4Y4_9MICO|nr:response regulator transcription factor [Microbacterium azadirachtae]SDL34329.1 two component transcriptional regulator, LuxR family [Microbacterium azadirachtae]SEF64822.1 two component transcriptional regulator, LuxR family [Microbacterium azadirachtae]SEF65660.1 two component transcriptional regulator, LuxR family [Microbacterium azadirachtae]SFR37259.1 two component transcriptional regulator, LuxR family [Microbacterium azadirachtae]
MNPYPQPVTVLLADDEQLIRSALAALLPLKGDITVVAEAADGREAVRLTRERPPDVVVMDLDMPVMDGLQAAMTIHDDNPDQIIILLTRHAKPGVLRRALKAGVLGFLSKAADPQLIADVIHTVARRQRWIDPGIAALAMTDDCPLTERELDVLRETTEGYAVTEIARRLYLAHGTVRNYLSNAMQKTQTTTRHEAARYAREHDWL